MAALLTISDLSICVQEKKIVKDLSLSINPGSVHALMGPNGSGKSSLAYALMGHPTYTIEKGTVSLEDQNLLDLPVHERIKAGLFLAFQYPQEVPGVELFTFLKEIYYARFGQTDDFQDKLDEAMELLELDYIYMFRNLNESFSGGEKKRFELLQLLLLQPKIVVLDEIDSGLDVDALKIVARALQAACKKNPTLSLLLITHYQRILNYIQPDQVHIMYAGSIVSSGSFELACSIEDHGYEQFYENR